MKEEFTTAMHADMLSGEESAIDMKLCGVYGAMQRLGSLEKALAEYNVSRDTFMKGIARALDYKTDDNPMLFEFISKF